ncbi:MAG: hypothetical protein RR945_06960 [Erysipelotrichaceae bacterium]
MLNVINKIGDFILGIPQAIWNFFKASFDIINNFLNFIWKGIESLVNFFMNFFKTLGDFITNLFVPKADYFDKKFQGFQNILNSKINLNDYKNSINSLKNATSTSTLINPQNLSIFGTSLNIDVFKYVNQNISFIHLFIRALMFLILLRYNINNVYKLIRGGDMSKGSDDE